LSGVGTDAKPLPLLTPGKVPNASFREESMAIKIDREADNVPTEEEDLRQLEQYIELGELAEIFPPWFPAIPRYLVTYMKSQTPGKLRSATVVSIANQSTRPNVVAVSWFNGLTPNTSPVGLRVLVIPPDFTVNLGSRDLPVELTALIAVSNPQLLFNDGRAIVSSSQPEIGVSARVYYTSGDRDEELHAITDSKVVKFGEGNNGD
jgi:hypothetical protein